MSATLLGQSVLSGLFSGSLYALLGLGLTLSWRYLKVINLAHFAFIFLAAYLTYQLAGPGKWNPLAAILVLIPCFFALGVAQQAFLDTFKVDEFGSIIVTFGLTILAESLIQWIWSADFIRLETHFLRGSFEVGPFFLPKQEFALALVALAICALCAAVMRHTWLGKALRASLDNPAISAAFGVPNRRLAFLVAGASGALAAIGGGFMALLFNLAPAQIYAWFGIVLAAVLLGGLGSAMGIFAAGLLLGVSEAVTMAITAPAWAPVVPFTLLILILVLWPERV
jgi:branched-chain amino acid transport system permease protein